MQADNAKRCGIGLGRWLAATILFLPAGPGTVDIAEAEDNRIAACFADVARTVADATQGKDDLVRNLAEMKAANACNKLAAEVIRACLVEVDAGNEDAKDYYPCIGTVANVCIDSDFATTEFRKVVCIGSEEQVWLDLVHEDLAALKTRLDGEARERLERLEKAFFDYRNLQCELFRTVFEGDEPDVAYGACTTEAAARFAIDLRALKAKALARSAPDTAATPFPGTHEGAERLLSRFLAKGADHAALTAELKPAPEDYAAVYQEPLARRLREAHAKTWTEGFTVQPDAAQTELKVAFSTSDRLGTDSDAAAAFPGGYRRVLTSMKAGIPIVAFKFVQPGQPLGRSFDGLVHVNGRWVLIPKPWRELD
jgi:hypothetical protein